MRLFAFKFCAFALSLSCSAIAADEYPLGPDSARQPGVPQGKVTNHKWTSKIFPGTVRDYWVYVPAQYNPAQPAALMVFQDGGSFIEEDRWRVPVVFDNLIQKGEMPVTIGAFINPGILPALNPDQQDRYNRSFEYDALGDRYARFLTEEILPEVSKEFKLTDDPNLRAIGGSSSGGICAFTVAWQRPDAFRRVLSFIGSYTNLRGGEIYSSLIRKTEPKPLRVFLQDGRNDLNLYAGSWFIANQDMASALEYAGYESNFIVGSEGHNKIHGSSILPDALRWLWHDWTHPIRAASGAGKERHYATEILDPGSDWEVVSRGHKFTEGPAVSPKGEVYFTDIPNNRIHKIALDGKVSVFKEDTGAANGLMFGPDGRLYACQNGRKRIVAYSPDGTESVIADGVESNDLAVNHRGEIYFSDPPNHRVWYIDAKGAKQVVHEGLQFPNGVILSPDESLLMVADSRSKWVTSFQVQPDGSLANGEALYRLETPDQASVGGDGMTVDSEGYLYVATDLGIQVCDQPGRVVAILNSGVASNVVFGGPDLDTLYVTVRDKVVKRKMRRHGIFPWQPVKPPKPRL